MATRNFTYNKNQVSLAYENDVNTVVVLHNTCAEASIAKNSNNCANPCSRYTATKKIVFADTAGERINFEITEI